MRLILLLAALLSLTLSIHAQDDETTTLTITTTLEGHFEGVTDVAFSPDGTLLASTANDASTRLWDVETGEQLAELYEHATYTRGVAFNPEGTQMVTTSWDRTLVFYDVDGQTLSPTDTFSGVLAVIDDVAYSPNGETIAFTVGDGTLALINATDLEEISRFAFEDSLQVNALDFSADGTLLAGAGGFPAQTAQIWQVDSPDAPIATLEGHDGAVMALDFSPVDNRVIATGSDDGTLRLWELTEDALIPNQLSSTMMHNLINTAPTWVTAVAFHPDGDLIAVGLLDGSVIFLDVSDYIFPEVIVGATEAHSNTVNAITFNADGSLAATAGEDGVIYLWEVSR